MTGQWLIFNTDREDDYGTGSQTLEQHLYDLQHKGCVTPDMWDSEEKLSDAINKAQRAGFTTLIFNEVTGQICQQEIDY